jgi:hypothetical protein
LICDDLLFANSSLRTPETIPRCISQETVFRKCNSIANDVTATMLLGTVSQETVFRKHNSIANDVTATMLLGTVSQETVYANALDAETLSPLAGFLL